MRELKFRAWLPALKKMSHPFDIFHVPLKENMEDCPIMQFTGLFDREGKEIWEGDILRYRYDEMEDWSTAQVKWGGDYPAFEIYPNHFYEASGLMTIVEDWHCEVIGNQYENPELLKP